MALSPGNTAVDFTQHQFTLDEAAKVSGVAPMTLRNWLARDQEKLGIGQKHKLGRWLFSGVEIIRLRVMGDLSLCGVQPSMSSVVSKLAEKRFTQMSARNAAGEIVETHMDFRRDLRIVISFDASNKMFATELQWDGESYASPAHKGTGVLNLRRPHIVIPVDLVIFDVQKALFSLLDLEPDNDGPAAHE